MTRLLPWLRAWAELLDSRFRIPGTNIRFGIDPILSLVPGIGELASPVFTALLIAQGIAQGVPKVVLARMVGNALLAGWVLARCFGIADAAHALRRVAPLGQRDDYVARAVPWLRPYAASPDDAAQTSAAYGVAHAG